MTDELSTSDDRTEAVRAKQAVNRRIRAEAVRQLESVDLNDLDSRVEALPMLCRHLPEEMIRELQD